MRLYREFTSQEAIDAEYNAAAAVPQSAAIVARWTEASADVRARLACRLGLKYGPTRAEYLDLFPAGPGAPVHLVLPRGCWRASSAPEFSFAAEPLPREGVAVGVVNYALCPEVTIDEIVRPARAATAPRRRRRRVGRVPPGSRDLSAARAVRRPPGAPLEIDGVDRFPLRDGATDPANPLFARLLELVRASATAPAAVSRTASS